jgi:hypothetical protein
VVGVVVVGGVVGVVGVVVVHSVVASVRSVLVVARRVSMCFTLASRAC